MMPAIDERRRREWAFVVLSLVLLLVTSVYVTRLMVAAWNTNGLIYYTWWTLVETTPISKESAITVPAGVLIGWLLLFFIDEYKRVQAVLLGLVATPAFIMTLFSLEQWIWIDPVAAIPGLLVGTLLGLLTGSIGGQSPLVGHNRWTFPTAAKALSAIIGFGGILAFLERYIPYRITVDPPEPWMPTVLGVGQTGTASGVVTVALDAASILLLIGVVNYFIQYSDRKDIVLICPDDRTLVNLLGGMYELAREQYNGKTVIGHQDLNAAAVAVSDDHLPEFSAPLSFQYRLPGPLNRRTIVTADRARRLTQQDVDRIKTTAQKHTPPAFQYLHALRAHLLATLPRFVRDGFSTSYAETFEQIEDADVVLLVAPLADIVDEDRLQGGSVDNYDELTQNDPAYLENYELVCQAYGGVNSNIYIVTPDGELARDVYELKTGSQPSWNAPQLVDFVANSLLDITIPCEILVVSRPLDESSEHKKEGFDRLLTTI